VPFVPETTSSTADAGALIQSKQTQAASVALRARLQREEEIWPKDERTASLLAARVARAAAREKTG
jgi:hypothetical protein